MRFSLVSSFRPRPGCIALLAVLLVATVLRLAYLFRAPVFITQDSVDYFQAGYELAGGMGFDAPARRTLGYPLFVAASIVFLGEEPLALAFAQHLLGVAIAGLVYLIGRDVFGRAAGLLAGLLAALSGPLLIYEHSIMSETLFTFLVCLSVWLAAREPAASSAWSVGAAGGTLALATLVRPVGLALLPALWLAGALRPIDWRRRLRQGALMAVGFAIVLGPTVLWGRVSGREAAPSSGSFLYDRLARHDQRFAAPDRDSPAPYDEPRRVVARRVLLELVPQKASRDVVVARLVGRLGLTEIEADRAMRDVAIEIIQAQPTWYLEGSLRNFREIMLGEVQVNREYRHGRKERETWLDSPSIAHALPAVDPMRQEQAGAAWLAGVFQPAQHRTLLGLLVLAGVLLSLLRAEFRRGLALAAGAVGLVFAGAALVGDVLRYRYPADPLFAVLAGGGLAALVQLAALGMSRRSRLEQGARQRAEDVREQQERRVEQKIVDQQQARVGERRNRVQNVELIRAPDGQATSSSESKGR